MDRAFGFPFIVVMSLPYVCGDRQAAWPGLGISTRSVLGASSVLPLLTQVFIETLHVRLCPRCSRYPTKQQPKISTLPVLILEPFSERWLASGLLAQTTGATSVSPTGCRILAGGP